MLPGVPDDATLLEAGGWSTTPSARILAKAVADDLCVVLLDANGALGAKPYETIEFYARTEDGSWIDDGHIGPGGDGLGWHCGYVYLIGRASAAEVVVTNEGRTHHIPTTPMGRWIFVAGQPEFDPQHPPHQTA